MDIKVGQIVISKAGRDKGMVFVVVGIKNDGHFLLADGKTRRLLKPKLKKHKHLQATNFVSLEKWEKDADIINIIKSSAIGAGV